ncbi:hypothetical protein KM043_013295 [Ampulex compressa]|nr:hypothetical protein KM043_013295 [Ampulex compressa]
MVGAEDDRRDRIDVDITENMESNQQNGELVAAEQNNEERDVNAEIDEQRKKYQPTRLESFFAITKSLIIRGLIIYFISYLFRRPQADINLQSSNGINNVWVNLWRLV